MQRKRFCTLLLAACFVVGMLVFPVSAAVDSGTYGDNIKWEFDTATGTLTISGTGTATGLSMGSTEGYMKYQLDIRHLIIADGFTSVGVSAFDHIGWLESIWIADSVKSVEQNAFADNFHATKLHLGNGITTIGINAFATMQSLESLVLPPSVQEIGVEAFALCGAKSIAIPEGITVIYEGAFRACENLTQVMIPASVTQIKYAAFRDCKQLTDVYYTGTQAQWEAMDINDEVDGQGASNGALFTATIHYNHTHTWDDGTVITAATCAEEGAKTHTCTVCGAVKTETVSKLSQHTWDGGKQNADTTVTYTCTVCHTTKTEGTPAVNPPAGQENTATEETASQTDAGTTATESTETTATETNGNPTEPDDTASSGGYPWAVLIIAILLAGGGAAAWFLLRKKQ